MDINFSLLLPELAVTVLAFLVLVISLLVPKEQRKGLGYFTIFGLMLVLILLYKMIDVEGALFNGMYIVDPFATFFKMLVVLSSLFTIILGTEYVDKFIKDFYSEFCYMILFATLGMMALVSAGDFITLYVALELMTIAFIVLVGFGKSLIRSSEAAIKYLLLSALSSALLLYGLTLVYGATKTTFIYEIVNSVFVGNGANPAVLLGLIFILSGFAFKVSVVPFHMWTPDVYEGAPTPTTALLSVASKGAGFGVFLRVFLKGFPEYASFWLPVIFVLALITMILGNFVAIPQKNIKRLLAYSGIAQAGYILLGLLAFSTLGVTAALFYTMMYVLCNMGAFGVVIAFSQAGGSDEIDDYNGLWKRSPLLSAVMLISLLSLAGIPPFVGFVGKFKLFMSIIDSGYIWLALIGILLSMVSVYYYLLVAKAMYLKDPVPNKDSKIKVPAGTQVTLLLITSLTIFLGIYPTPLTNLAIAVAKTFF